MRLRTDDPISFDESIAQLKKLKRIAIVGDKITGDLEFLQTPSWNTIEQKPSALSKFWLLNCFGFVERKFNKHAAEIIDAN